MKPADDGGDPRPYQVGKNRPPVEHQFKKGISGNPNGRPRKTKKPQHLRSFDPYVHAVLSETERPVAIRDADGTTEISAHAAAIRRLKAKALAGDFRSIKLLDELHREAIRRRQEEAIQMMQFVQQYKQIWDPVFRTAREQGRPEPEQFPHPDHVKFCFERGMLQVVGPENREEKQEWDQVKAALQTVDQFLRLHEDLVKPDEATQLLTKKAKTMKRSLLKGVPGGWDWTEA